MTPSIYAERFPILTCLQNFHELLSHKLMILLTTQYTVYSYVYCHRYICCTESHEEHCHGCQYKGYTANQDGRQSRYERYKAWYNTTGCVKYTCNKTMAVMTPWRGGLPIGKWSNLFSFHTFTKKVKATRGLVPALQLTWWCYII